MIVASQIRDVLRHVLPATNPWNTLLWLCHQCCSSDSHWRRQHHFPYISVDCHPRHTAQCIAVDTWTQTGHKPDKTDFNGDDLTENPDTQRSGKWKLIHIFLPTLHGTLLLTAVDGGRKNTTRLCTGVEKNQRFFKIRNLFFVFMVFKVFFCFLGLSLESQK